MGQRISNVGEISSATSRDSGRQRKKKQFRRGAVKSITNRTDVHATKQTAAACAVMGNWRNRSISFIALLSGKSGSADMNTHGPGFEEYLRPRSTAKNRDRAMSWLAYFFLLYSA